MTEKTLCACDMKSEFTLARGSVRCQRCGDIITREMAKSISQRRRAALTEQVATVNARRTRLED